MVDAVTGRSARRQARLAEAAQASQRAELEEQRRRVREAERGQQQINAGGGRGMLAFVDEALATRLGSTVTGSGGGGARIT